MNRDRAEALPAHASASDVRAVLGRRIDSLSKALGFDRARLRAGAFARVILALR